MGSAETFHEDQRQRWNGADGEYWTLHQDRLDKALAGVLGPLIAFAAPKPASTVIDIGCGCGATTIELAKAVGDAGRVIGLDISEPMLALARERLRGFAGTECICGDAAALDLSGVGAELVTSRFGVMFFGDPAAAFANIRKGMAAGGRLRFACWRPLPENPWLGVPLRAACEHVPPLPKPDPEEPGPFSFGDPARVTRILTAAGFTAPTFTPLDVEIDLGGGAGLDAAVEQAASMGPAKKAMTDQPEELRAKAIESIRKALTPFASGDSVKLRGAVWLVAAEVPQK